MTVFCDSLFQLFSIIPTSLLVCRHLSVFHKLPKELKVASLHLQFSLYINRIAKSIRQFRLTKLSNTSHFLQCNRSIINAIIHATDNPCNKGLLGIH